MEDCAEHLARIQQGKPSYLSSTLKPRKMFLQRERKVQTHRKLHREKARERRKSKKSKDLLKNIKIVFKDPLLPTVKSQLYLILSVF